MNALLNQSILENTNGQTWILTNYFPWHFGQLYTSTWLRMTLKHFGWDCFKGNLTRPLKSQTSSYSITLWKVVPVTVSATVWPKQKLSHPKQTWKIRIKTKIIPWWSCLELIEFLCNYQATQTQGWDIMVAMYIQPNSWAALINHHEHLLHNESLIIPVSRNRRVCQFILVRSYKPELK